MKKTEHFVGIFAIFLLLAGCKTIQYVPVEHTEYVHTVDSVYLKDTVVQVEVEKARISDFVGMLDTLSIHTDISDFRAYCDTSTATLRGDVRQSGTIPVKIVWKEKVSVRDSIVYQDRPVPVEVVKTVHPKYEWALWVWGIVALLLLGFLLYRKIMPIFVGRRLL